MARQVSTPLSLAAPPTPLTLTLRAALLTAALATLAACSDPMGPTSVDANRPSLGGGAAIDPDAPAYRPSRGGAAASQSGLDPTDH